MQQPNRAWGTACTNTNVSQEFCAASLCTGLEKVSAQVRGGAVTHGALGPIDHNSGTGGKTYRSGADTSNNLQANGIVANVVESPQLGLQFNASVNNNNSVLNVVRNRLSVGGRTDDSDGRAMALNPVTGYNGVAYVDTVAYTQSFSAVLNTGPVPAMGSLTSIHGTGGKNVMAAGSQGTIVAYDGAKWTQLVPTYTGMPVAWTPWGAAWRRQQGQRLRRQGQGQGQGQRQTAREGRLDPAPRTGHPLGARQTAATYRSPGRCRRRCAIATLRPW